MTIFQAIILGIVQGVTEFLPISSSAHLVLVPLFLKWDIPQEHIFPFDVLVQLGTLVAVILYFRNDLIAIISGFINALSHRNLQNTDFRLGLYLILATIPAGLAGLLFEDLVEQAFHTPVVTMLFLLLTATLLLAAEKIGQRNKNMQELTWKDALWIGFSQILALFPGVSRSGATITGGMTRHLDRPTAGRFSFLMSIPIMLAAGLWKALDLFQIPDLANFLPVLITGFVVAAIIGYLSIHWLLSFLKNNSLVPFAIYCVSISCISMIVMYVF